MVGNQQPKIDTLKEDHIVVAEGKLDLKTNKHHIKGCLINMFCC